MVETSNDNYSPEENSVIFFRHVKRDLGIPSTKKMATLVGNVLSNLQNRLDEDQAKQLVTMLPGPLQLLAVKSRKGPRTGEISSDHLDELVEDVYEEDRKSGSRLLSTEVHALNAVVVILRKLDKYLNLFSYDFLRFRLVDSLRKIPIEG